MAKNKRNLADIKMIKTATALTGGRFINLAVSLILFFIQSRFIGPETTGICQAYAIPVGYLWIFTFGVPSALARELPYYLAKGEKEKAMKLSQTAQSFSVVMGCLCASAFLVLSIRALMLGHYLSAAGWGVQIITAFFTMYNQYILTLFRTNDEFIQIATSNTISAIASIVAFPLIFLNPYLGVWAKGLAALVGSNAYLHIKRPFKLKFKFEWAYFKPLVTFGMPLITIGYIESALWSSTQSSLILRMGGTTYLGLFSFVNTILAAMLIIPNAVADILRPKFAMVYGESGGDMTKTLKVAVRPLLASLAVSTIVVVFSWLTVGHIVARFLPKYAAAVPALDIALLTVPIMTVKCVKYVFVVCKDMKYNLLSTAPGFIVGIGLLYLFLSRGAGPRYMFLPYVLGQLFNFVVSCILLSRKSRVKE